MAHAKSETRPAATPPTPPAAPALDEKLTIEAALFSAGKPLALDELAENTGMRRDHVERALKALAAEYEARDGALEVGKAGAKWAMQVRAAYVPATSRLAPMEVAPKLLKTLALIAYHQPVLQSAVQDMIGAKVYDHVRELQELGLVKKRIHERSFMLLTSDRFPEYFGIPASDREEIKNHLARAVGLPIPEKDAKGNKRLETFPPAPQAGTGDPAAGE